MRTEIMTLYEWLAGINDDYLLAWANKGLLRRGRKLLAQQDPNQWTLDETQASASLDGWEQHLDGVGFEHLNCGCPAMGPCHHLLAFLLGLKQRLAQGEVVGDPPQTPSEAGTTVAAPWLIDDPAERQAILGKAHLERARRWLAQGLAGVLSEDDQGLKGELPEPLSAQVIIPQAGGIAHSLCSCKEPRCGHRALVVLQACREAGLPDHEEDQVDALTEDQRELLATLEPWLRLLALQGMSGIPRLHIEQGRALVTELQQVDLPLPARQLARVAEMLEQEWGRQSVSSPARLRQALAILSAHVGALSRQPLPQPLLSLAGRHRRRYTQRHDLDLVGVATEVWETLSGYRGYSAYFYAPQDGGYFQLSEARKPDQEPGWDPGSALAQARFGEQKVIALLGSRVRMLNGWCSLDNRLSAREGCRLTEPQPLSFSELFGYAENLSQLAIRLAGKARQNPYEMDLHAYGLIAVEGSLTLVFDRYRQHWQGEVSDPLGRVFELSLAGTELGHRAARRLKKISSVKALFGRWRIEGESLCLEPVAVWYEDQCLMLTLWEAHR
jgi:hypothetical protein